MSAVEAVQINRPAMERVKKGEDMVPCLGPESSVESGAETVRLGAGVHVHGEKSSGRFLQGKVPGECPRVHSGQVRERSSRTWGSSGMWFRLLRLDAEAWKKWEFSSQSKARRRENRWRQ